MSDSVSSVQAQDELRKVFDDSDLALHESLSPKSKEDVQRVSKKRKADEMALLTSDLNVVSNKIAKEMVTLALQSRQQQDKQNADSLEKLSKTQKWAYDAAVVKRLSAMITGPAGTGKSHLYHLIYEALIAKGLKVSRVASTGVAAVNVCGTTWHEWMGIGLGDKSIDDYVERIEGDEEHLKRLKECDVLMIDEISMITPEYFAKCDRILKIVRGKSAPFGGIQMLAFGDFLQLPPIIDSDSNDDGSGTKIAFKDRVPFSRPSVPTIEFPFELKIWNETFKETIELDVIYRQTDNVFRGLLNRARFGELNAQDIAILKSRINAPVKNPIELRSFRKEVHEMNHKHLESIQSPIEFFYSSQGYTWSDKDNEGMELSDYQERLVKRLAHDCPAPAFLKLKVGARVMFLWNENVEEGLVNGAQGVVIGFEEEESNSFVGDDRKFKIPVVQFDNGLIKPIKRHRFMAQDRDTGFAWVFRVPLKLSKAITIHKSQGLQFDEERTRVDESIFTFNQAYVAISRCKSLEGLSLEGFTPDAFRAHPKALVYYKRLAEKKRQMLLLRAG